MNMDFWSIILLFPELLASILLMIVFLLAPIVLALFITRKTMRHIEPPSDSSDKDKQRYEILKSPGYIESERKQERKSVYLIVKGILIMFWYLAVFQGILLLLYAIYRAILLL